MAKSIYINLDASSLRASRVRNETDLRSVAFTQLVAGDSFDFNLYVVNSSGLQNIQDYASVRVGIGGSDARPDAGTYTIAGSNTLNYNHSATELETIIDSAVSDATVTELAPFVFKIQFAANGTQTIPAVDGRLLSPRSTVDVARMITGDSSTPETWLWRLYRNPLAFTSTFTNISGNGITGTLDLNTSGIYDLIANKESDDTFFEVELTNSEGNITTVMQTEVTILGEVIGQSFNGTVPQPTGLPAEASAFLQTFPNPQFAGDVTFNGAISGTSVDKKSFNTVTSIASGTAYVGGDQTGNLRGAGAIDIQSVRGGNAKIAKGTNSLAIGSESLVTGNKSSVIGRVNEVKSDNTHAIGELNIVADTADESSILGRKNTISGKATVCHGNNLSVSADTQNSIVIGRDNATSSNADDSIVLGGDITMQGSQATAIGYGASVLQDNSSAIGRHVRVNVVAVNEFGGWYSDGRRGAAVRCANLGEPGGTDNGHVAMTLNNISYSPLDGGSTVGDEHATTLPREMVSLRRNGNELLADVNIGGTVKSVSFGDATRRNDGDSQSSRQPIGSAIQNDRRDANSINSIRQLTQAQYDAISSPDANTMYVIVG